MASAISLRFIFLLQSSDRRRYARSFDHDLREKRQILESIKDGINRLFDFGRISQGQSRYDPGVECDGELAQGISLGVLTVHDFDDLYVWTDDQISDSDPIA